MLHRFDYYFSLMPGGLVFSSGAPKKKLQSGWPLLLEEWSEGRKSEGSVISLQKGNDDFSRFNRLESNFPRSTADKCRLSFRRYRGSFKGQGF